MGILNAIAGIFKPVADVVDSLHTSDEERLTIKQKLLEVQAGVVMQAIELEKAQLEERAKIIVAEAQSESWITRSWRPITMLTFVVLIVLIATGWMDTEALAAVPDKLWTLLQIGIGGYIVSRGAEKVIPDVVGALKAREEA